MQPAAVRSRNIYLSLPDFINHKIFHIWQNCLSVSQMGKVSSLHSGNNQLLKSLIYLQLLHEQRPYGVEHCDDHDAHVREDRQPHIGDADRS